MCSTISVNEIKVLQNSQFDLTFLKVITLFFIENVFNNRDRVIHMKIKYSFVANQFCRDFAAKSPVISPSGNPPVVSQNIFHWSKFKARSHRTFFS